MKPLNSGHLRLLKNVSVIERCPLLGGNLKKISHFGTKRIIRYSRHVRYLGCPLLGGFTIYICISWYSKICWFPMKKCWCQCAKFHHCRICVTGFTKRAFLLSRFPWAAPKRHIWIGLSQLCGLRIFQSKTCSKLFTIGGGKVLSNIKMLMISCLLALLLKRGTRCNQK